MFSISGLARHANLPRRTVQFWADNDVLVPAHPQEESEAPRVYSALELDVARMLKPFVEISSPIGVLKLLAAVFRWRVLDITAQSADDEELFAPMIDAARRNRTAFLAVQLIPKSDETAWYIVHLGPALNARQLSKSIDEQMRSQPHYPVIVVNVTDALSATGARHIGSGAGKESK